jgi:hypothetical protein
MLMKVEAKSIAPQTLFEIRLSLTRGGKNILKRSLFGFDQTQRY